MLGQNYSFFSLALRGARGGGVPVANGGQITQVTSGGALWQVHRFEDSGLFELPAEMEIDYLLAAGGGAGGSGNGAGGGAGGLLIGRLSLAAGSYPVIIGAGGAGQPPGEAGPGNDGSDSLFATLVAVGGGGGGSQFTPTGNGRDGGSGGGASGSGGVGTFASCDGGAGLSGQGHDGGFNPDGLGASGGGGAGAPGVENTQSMPGHGGDGLLSDITGTPTWYCGGGGGQLLQATAPGDGGLGGGGAGGNNNPGASGAPNTGGGGGGSKRSPGSGTGGSGVVILSYRIGEAA
ncbi:MAG: hypothetical protein JXJ18_09595 [Rhodobacteraceae bacterium]|nr:hypothetical protein [Paracoccaceae bacterium]